MKAQIKKRIPVPSTEKIQEELSRAQTIDDFFGKDGIIANLCAKTMEQMMEAELTESLGYPKSSPLGYHSGNSRNGKYKRKIRTSAGDTQIKIPRDRNNEYESKILRKYQTSSNEIEDKITAMYARGMTVNDIHDLLEETYGMNVSPGTISTVTEKVMPLVKEWQTRPLEVIYPIIYLDCIHDKLRVNGKITTVAVYNCLGINLEGKKELLGIWATEEAEGSNFWLTVVSDLQERGVKDILIACVDGLSGFKEAIQSVYPETIVQKCVIHQIRNSLKYVSYKDRKEFVKDLKGIYAAPNKEMAEDNLLKLGEKWKSKYAISIKSWENNWDDLSVYFDYPKEIRKLIYTTNIIEGYHRQIRKVTKTRSIYPTKDSILKMHYLATRNIEKKWTMPIKDWTKIFNQLAIRFEGRIII